MRKTDSNGQADRLARSLGDPVRTVSSRRHSREFRGRVARLRDEILAALAGVDRGPGADIAAGEEWLLDNRHVVLHAVEQVLEDVPAGFFAVLPRISDDMGMPRVERLAHELVEAHDGYVDAEAVLTFVGSFQTVMPLDMGELWALPAFLRLLILERLLASFPGKTSSDGGRAIAASITSLREIDQADWKAVFESLSVVERSFRRLDPSRLYTGMDFATRDRYRKAVEELARWGGIPETRVALETVGLARGEDRDENHVGHFLVGDRRVELETALGTRLPLRRRGRRLLLRYAGPFYFGLIGLLSLVFAAAPLVPIVALGADPLLVILGALLVAAPSVSVAVAVVNAAATLVIPPRRLPRMDFSSGVPPSWRTCVAVPALLSDEREVAALLGQLELNYRGNARGDVVFALLGDPPDADAGVLESDTTTLAAAEEGVDALNRRYGEEGATPFLLLVRPRRWNPAEGRWMARERKRGKLHELNRLVLGHRDVDLEVRKGDPTSLEGVRLVLTLDADTFLPQGTAARLVGTMAHPLNRPRFDRRGRVTRGYTVLQPRVETLVDPTAGTRFTRIFQADEGLDLYSHAVSDVYQDLFGEGIYVGKGLYDVESFERSLDGRVPVNALLSHDLFEGAHGRAGLVSDLAVIEDFPPTPAAYMRRLHRWVRGDWQLLPWLRFRVPSASPQRIPNRLPLLARWMIADNLRRSLVFPTLLGLAAAGWLVLPGSAWWWTGWVVAYPGVPVILAALSRAWTDVRRPPDGAPFGRETSQLLNPLVRWGFAIAFLPWRAVVELDAVARTLYRLGVSRRHLLQWTPAAQTARLLTGRSALGATVGEAVPGALVAVVLGAGLLVRPPGDIAAPAVLLAVWLVSPVAAWLLATPRKRRREELSREEILWLRSLARRSWAYFARLTTPEDHWLPPDNLQIEPDRGVAHRTSPTNIGLGMLAVAVAHDLGHLTLTRATATLTNLLETMERLERHRGHLLNWYNTRNLQPLAPRYVSSVDSGNLTACLVAVREALVDFENSPFPRPADVAGLRDTLAVTAAVIREGGLGGDGGGEAAKVLEGLASLLQVAENRPEDLPSVADETLAVILPPLEAASAALVEASPPATDGSRIASLREWLGALHRHLVTLDQEIRTLFPWLRIPLSPPEALATSRPGTPLEAAWSALLAAVPARTSLRDAAAVAKRLKKPLDGLRDALEAETFEGPLRHDAAAWLGDLDRDLEAAAARATAVRAELAELRDTTGRLVAGTDFRFLFDERRGLLHVGYNVDAAELDRSYYDLYASEARLASYVGMAKGDLPVEHWLRLGRPFGRRDGSTVLLSWAGTMFEYLMPSLFLQAPEGCLSDRACRRALEAQIAFGRRHRLPWGISESGYADLDVHAHYRYRAFGVPALALRRDSNHDRIVVAPYATALALSLRPATALGNLQRLAGEGLMGPLGFLEAVDYGGGTRRQPRVVRSVMAHHQGMILAAVHHLLTGAATARRFHRDSAMATLTYLLHEESPDVVRATTRTTPPVARAPTPVRRPSAPPWAVDPESFPSPTMVMSNGSLSTLITASGSGGLRWKGLDVLRWRPDPTTHAWGLWIYVRDTRSDRVWSATRAPTTTAPDRYEVLFAGEVVEVQRNDGPLKMRTSIAVSPSADVEIRRVTLVNEGDELRSLELTSFAEVALAAPPEDRRHPAFGRLFVEGRFVPESHAVVFGRRSEGLDEEPLFVAHSVTAGEGQLVGWETDRGRFLGRDPACAAPPGVLNPGRREHEGEMHAPLDPVASLTWRIDVPSGAERTVTFVTAAGRARSAALRAIEAHRSAGSIQWVLDQAREGERALQRELEIQPEELPAFQRLLSAIVFPYHRLRREPPSSPDPGAPGARQTLWALGVSGDLPVVVVSARESARGELLRSVVRAHAYWERRGVTFDLVVVAREPDEYGEPLGGWLSGVLARAGRSDRLNRPGGVHYVSAGRLAPGDERRLKQAASLFLDGSGGSLAGAVARLERVEEELPPFVPVPSSALRAYPSPDPLKPPAGLKFFNGLGGFHPDGQAYVIHLDAGVRPPAPWINVVANPSFGFTVSESGAGFTWDGNSGERRLTPWSNDPALDPAAEAVYLRDEETGTIWSPTPGPAGAEGASRITHRPGMTVFLHRSHGLEQRTRLFVPGKERVKVTEVMLRNRWPRPRRITVTCYVEWVLGPWRSVTAPHLVTTFAHDAQAILAHNRFQRAPVGFLASDGPAHGFTCDRAEFLGPRGRRERPAGLVRIGLAGTTGAGLDPCGALQVHVDLAPGEERTVRFFLGALDEPGELEGRLRSLRDAEALERGKARVVRLWDDLLRRTTVRTPEPSMDLLLNGWLRYQAVACRLWGRSGFYQSSGAFGFRDQLQDGLGLLDGAPGICRERIVEAASRQFREGDVLHWWHPDTGHGVRTRCSDDRLWLPYVVASYVDRTGDESVLAELAPFLVAPPLEEGEVERYGSFEATGVPASVYEHCIRALERPGTIGPRGVPLIGSGDWNDGLNRVGVRGSGESFWLGWFLARVCLDFAAVCDRRGESERARRLRERAEHLRAATEAHGWDGAWYRRATYDDGSPLGSSENLEGRIDSLPQSWAVLSSVGDPERARRALESVWRELVDPANRLVLLLAPPYHETPRHPGYIKSYPPGVRENGGQYTHAAAWVGWAFAASGDGDRAEEVFRLLNPILRTTTPAEVDLYRVEPYVLAGDVYAGPGHAGRGGWTWYTGSASWVYRLGAEAILGLGFVQDELRLDPCIPRRWKRFVAKHRHGASSYHILVRNPEGVCRGVRSVTLDGAPLEEPVIPLEDDGRHHHVVATLGPGRSPDG